MTRYRLSDPRFWWRLGYKLFPDAAQHAIRSYRADAAKWRRLGFDESAERMEAHAREVEELIRM